MTYRIRATHENKTVEFYVYDQTWWLKLFQNTAGITLGKQSVYLKRTLAEALDRNPYIVAHEAIHVFQAHALGWKYIPNYIWQAITAGFVKSNIPMEQDAYQHERLVSWKILS